MRLTTKGVNFVVSKGSNMKRTVYGIILLSSFFIWQACGNRSETITAEYRDITEAVYASGNLYPENEYRLFANTEGIVLKRFVHAGDSVQKGTALFMLDREVDLSRLNTASKALQVAEKNAGESSPLLAELRAGLHSIRDKYQQDSANYARYQNLFEKEVVNLKTLEQYKLTFEISRNDILGKQQAYKRTQDQLKVELANAQTNYQTILESYDEHAPVSRLNGMVYEVTKEEGESVRRGELLAILGARDSMLVRLQVDELDFRRVHLGQEVIIRFDIDEGKIYKAKISHILSQTQ